MMGKKGQKSGGKRLRITGMNTGAVPEGKDDGETESEKGKVR